MSMIILLDESWFSFSKVVDLLLKCHFTFSFSFSMGSKFFDLVLGYQFTFSFSFN